MSTRGMALIAGLVVAVALLISGLSLGFASKSIETQTFGTLECGSAFSPKAPTMTGSMTPLQAGSLDELSSSTTPLADRCSAASSAGQAQAVVLVMIGVSGLVLTAAFGALSRRRLTLV